MKQKSWLWCMPDFLERTSYKAVCGHGLSLAGTAMGMVAWLSVVAFAQDGASSRASDGKVWRVWSDRSRGISLSIPSSLGENSEPAPRQVILSLRSKPGGDATGAPFPTVTVTEHGGTLSDQEKENFGKRVSDDYKSVGLQGVVLEKSFLMRLPANDPGDGDSSEVVVPRSGAADEEAITLPGAIVSYHSVGKPLVATVVALDVGDRYFLVTYIDTPRTFEEVRAQREQFLDKVRCWKCRLPAGVPRLLDEAHSDDVVQSPEVQRTGASESSQQLTATGLLVYFREPPYLGWLVVGALVLLVLKPQKRRGNGEE